MRAPLCGGTDVRSCCGLLLVRELSPHCQRNRLVGSDIGAGVGAPGGDANNLTSHVCDRLIFDAERSIAGVADVPRGLRLPTGLTGIGSRPAAIAFFRRGKVTQLLTLILSGGSARMSLQSGQTNSIAVWWTKLNFTAAISSKQLQLGHRSLPISTSSTTPSLRTGIQQILARKN